MNDFTKEELMDMRSIIVDWHDTDNRSQIKNDKLLSKIISMIDNYSNNKEIPLSIVYLKIKPATESERTLLGGLILDSKLFETIKGKLLASDFHHEEHRKLFDVMEVLYKKHGCFDAPMIEDYLNFENMGDICNAYELANSCCSTANIKSHADIIREKSVQRQLISIANNISETTKQRTNYIQEFFSKGGASHSDEEKKEIIEFVKQFKPLYCAGCKEFSILDRGKRFRCELCGSEIEMGMNTTVQEFSLEMRTALITSNVNKDGATPDCMNCGQAECHKCAEIFSDEALEIMGVI